MTRWRRLISGGSVLAACALAACDSGPSTVHFGPKGPVGGAAGRGSFTFGVATAGMQIEEGITASDWYYWTLPKAQGGLGNGTFVGDSVKGYERALADVQLVADTNLDAYRLNIPWARIEPQRDVIDQAALAHYDAVIDALVSAGIKPMITIHHFSSPIWVDDFRSTGPCTPSDTDLCGWDDPVGGPLVAQELAEFAALLAARYGDRVDEWGTLNEPVNYLVASHGAGATFPPGKSSFFTDDGASFVRAVRSYMSAHALVYDAIVANDTADADGDGDQELVGLTLNGIDWFASRQGEPSSLFDDLAAAQRIYYAYHYLFPDAVREGRFDAQLDQDTSNDEAHPEWTGKLDWLGIQYYSRTGVTAEASLTSLLDLAPCVPGNDIFHACVPPPDPTHCVPEMEYEYYEPGLHRLLTDLAARYPDLPLSVTESGIATESGRRRAEHVVRSLEQIARAMSEGIDVRGYYHWSLMDNFEWALGFAPRFGLYQVDLTTYARTPTEGQTVLSSIAASRSLPSSLRSRYGGLGPMTREPTPPGGPSWDDVTCVKF